MDSIQSVSGDRLAKQVVEWYFTKLDQDTQQDMFHYIRNFIVDQQEMLIENEVAVEEEMKDEMDDSDDSDEDEEVNVQEVEVDVLTPYDVAPVDLVVVYQCVRELYESYVVAPRFVTFREFYLRLTC